jgi:hypothetical protein
MYRTGNRCGEEKHGSGAYRQGYRGIFPTECGYCHAGDLIAHSEHLPEMQETLSFVYQYLSRMRHKAREP